MIRTKAAKRRARHQRIRARIKGVSGCPRLSVYRSIKNIQLQLIDDVKNNVIMSLSSTSKEVKGKLPYAGNIPAANLVGELFAKTAVSKGIKRVVFDRGGCAYHGRIKALAEALRKGGLVF